MLLGDVNTGCPSIVATIFPISFSSIFCRIPCTGAKHFWLTQFRLILFYLDSIESNPFTTKWTLSANPNAMLLEKKMLIVLTRSSGIDEKLSDDMHIARRIRFLRIVSKFLAGKTNITSSHEGSSDAGTTQQNTILRVWVSTVSTFAPSRNFSRFFLLKYTPLWIVQMPTNLSLDNVIFTHSLTNVFNYSSFAAYRWTWIFLNISSWNTSRKFYPIIIPST